MPKKQISAEDIKRIEGLQERVREETGPLRHGDSMIPTPEESRKAALIRKIREQGY